MLRAVQVVVDERHREADPGRPAGGARAAHRALRPAHQAGRRLRDRSIPKHDPRYRDYWTRVLPADRSASGVSQQYAQDRDAPPADADRRDDDPPAATPTACCAARSARTRCTCTYIDQVIGLRTGVKTYAAMNALMLPDAHGVHRRHLRQRRSHRRADRRDHAARRRGDPPLRHHAQGRAAVAFELRHRATHPQAREDAGGAGADQRDATPSSRSKARCTATPRWTRTCA